MTEPFGPGPTLADQMRRHAGDSQHLYGHLMRQMANDWETGGGPVQEICAGWEDSPPGWVIQLRLLAGLFRIVLTGRAPVLEPFYPCLGGTADPGQAWPAVREVLSANVNELRDALTISPQTNEVGRANALLVGIFLAVAHTERPKIRLFEPGSSAGLNLLVDRFHFVNPAWAYGPKDSPVTLAGGVVGEVRPVSFDILERRGCDVSPVDVTTEDGRLRLRSFVWPFHVERHERLAGALSLAQEAPATVDQASAAAWLEERLAAETHGDVLTVVWQSVTRQYWPADEVEHVDDVVRKASERFPVAHVSMEYPNTGSPARAELTIACSGGAGDNRFEYQRVGSVGDHGFPVTIGST
ncbi:MAG: DUF2332 domain-containing protein [Actinomycetota bacterium]|nr:DUF2332 domain-containing protein [Actinomycetota bacterium]